MDEKRVESIQDKLTQALTQGRYDGTSEFTVDTSAALSKLSGFQFPAPEYWIGKFVQLANERKAASVDIEIGMGGVEIAVEGADFSPAESIVSSVLSAKSTRDHLLSGLIALAGVKHYSILLQVRKGEAFSESFMGPGAKPEPKRSPSQGLLIVLSDHGNGKWRRRRAEQRFLRERCWISGVPITLNGKKLELRYSRGADGSLLHQLGLSGRVTLVNASLPALAGRRSFDGQIPSPEGRTPLEAASLGLNWTVPKEALVPLFGCFLLGTSSRATGGILNITFGSKKAMMVPVCDGVLLEPVEFAMRAPSLSHVMSQSGGLGFEAYLPVSHDETDLGHFRMRAEADWSRRSVVTVAPYLQRIWADFLNSPRGFRTIPTTRGNQRLVEGSIAFVTGGVAAGLGGVLAGGALGAVALGVPSAYLGGNIVSYYAWVFSRISRKVGGLMRMSGFAQSLDHLVAEMSEVEPFQVSLRQGTFLAGWRQWPDVTVLERGEWARLFFQFAQVRGGEFRFFSDESLAQLRWSDTSSSTETLDQLLGSNRLLQDGLGNLRELPLLSVSLERVINGLAEMLEWTADSLERSQVPAESAPGWALTVELKPKSSSWFERKSSRRGEEFEEARFCLREYCWMAENPPLVENEVVKARAPFPPSGKRSRTVWPYHQIPLVVARRDLPPPDAREQVLFSTPPQARHPRRSTEWGWLLEPGFELPETFLYQGDSSGTTGGVILLTAHHRSSSAVEFLHRGVVVEVLPLFHPEDYFPAERMHSNFWSMGKGEKCQLALRCLLEAPDWSGSLHLPRRRGRALEFLRTHRPEILQLAQLALDNFESLQFRLRGSQVVTRTGYLVSKTFLTREGARRKWLRKQLERFPQDFEAMLSQLNSEGK